MNSTLPTPPRFRPTQRRLDVIVAAVNRDAGYLMAEDATAFSLRVIGAEMREGARPTLADMQKFLGNRVEACRGVLKRRPITVDMTLPFDGELSAQFAQVFREFRKAASAERAAADIQVPAEGMIELRWSPTGYYRINRDVLLPQGNEKCEGFSGTLSVDEALLRSGGPFTIETVTAGHLRLRNLGDVLSKWKLALALCKGNGFGAKRNLRSIRSKDVLHRLRNGGTVSFERIQRGCVRVSLTAGRKAPEWLPQIKTRLENAEIRGSRLGEFETSLRTYGEKLAAAFINQPGMQAERMRREVKEAEVQFANAATSFHYVVTKYCFKAEVPPAPYMAMPEAFPTLKSVSRNQAHSFHALKAQFTSAWETLQSGRAALAVLQPPIATETAEVAPAPEAESGCHGQLLFALQ